METHSNEAIDGVVHYFACRCGHCYSTIATYAVGTTRTVFCDEHCARAEAALQRRMKDASLHRSLVDTPDVGVEQTSVRGARGYAGWIALRLVGVPLPIVAVLYLLRHYL
jgi:hypothetical protein